MITKATTPTNRSRTQTVLRCTAGALPSSKEATDCSIWNLVWTEFVYSGHKETCAEETWLALKHGGLWRTPGDMALITLVCCCCHWRISANWFTPHVGKAEAGNTSEAHISTVSSRNLYKNPPHDWKGTQLTHTLEWYASVQNSSTRRQYLNIWQVESCVHWPWWGDDDLRWVTVHQCERLLKLGDISFSTANQQQEWFIRDYHPGKCDHLWSKIISRLQISGFLSLVKIVGLCSKLTRELCNSDIKTC